MRSFIMHSMGEEFCPFPLEFVRQKLAAGLIRPTIWDTVVEDGKRISENRVADVIKSADGKDQSNSN